VIQGTADAGALERAGRLAFAGFELRSLASTTSTQDVVRAAARRGAAPGFCCMAAAQTAGRGRQTRRWIAPPGTALLFSVLVRVGHAHLGGVSIAAGLAVRAAVAARSGGVGRLKWPNDILAGDRKLAGILCEVEPAAPGNGTAVVIGAGVNLTVPSFPSGVDGISLHELVDPPPSASRLLAAVLPELTARLELLDHAGMAPLLAEWMDHATGIGAIVTATSAAGSVTGVAEGLGDDGALLIRAGAGVVRVLAGDVHLTSPAPRA
jgi:BirA family biotin operon repressor/biotin-[acetyl-CoA-carboxylase] ligase